MMKKTILGTLLFIIVTFVFQYLSHFLINANHYSSITFARHQEDVIFSLGFLAMVLQGTVLSYMYGYFHKGKPYWKNGLKYGFLMALFFVSYPAFVEPGKYKVPEVISWTLVEGTVGLLQFCAFGLLLGITFKRINNKP